MQISITRTRQPKPKPADSDLAFGTLFTDHMFQMDYSPQNGWHNPRIEPYGPLTMEPSTMVLHYGQGVFEGLKAFRTADDAIRMFRPKDNLRRMNRSARQLCIPELDEGLALEALKALVDLDRDWVPRTHGTSLYIRPTIIATGPLTSDRLAKEIMTLTGTRSLYVYDAISPIVTRESINMEVPFRASRYGKGGDEYINCPLATDQ